MKIQHTVLAGLIMTLATCTQAVERTAPSAPTLLDKQSPEKNIVNEQLIQITSQMSFDETVAKLRAGIAKRPLKLFAEVDHTAGAASIDLDLPSSTLFIFGNPKGGTPLMQRNPKMGIVLPLKIHVYKDGNTVYISYQDITAIAERYGLDKTMGPVPNIAAMLDGLANESSK